MSDSSSTTPPGSRAFSPWLIYVPMVIVILALVVTWNMLWDVRQDIYKEEQSAQRERERNRIPKYKKLTEPLAGIDSKGRPVSLDSFKGKVYVVSYVFTNCPAQCLGVAERMKELSKEFADEADFQLVSVSLDPEVDTPEVFDDWIKRNGLDYPNWTFITGDQKTIHQYMSKWFEFLVLERTDPAQAAALGRWDHTADLALVDRDGFFRTKYAVLESDGRFETLKMHIRRLLDGKETE